MSHLAPKVNLNQRVVTVILHLNASVNRRARRYYAPTVQNKVTIVYLSQFLPSGRVARALRVDTPAARQIFACAIWPSTRS